jgi:stage II sporulation protein AA (anti-sigma F factor antagonist)
VPDGVHGQAVPVIELSGDVDLTEVPSLRERILHLVDNQHGGLVLDFSAVTYLDSAGVNMLFELAEGLQQRQLAFALVLPEGGLVERVFSLVDLGSVAQVHRSARSAVEAVRGH